MQGIPYFRQDNRPVADAIQEFKELNGRGRIERLFAHRDEQRASQENGRNLQKAHEEPAIESV